MGGGWGEAGGKQGSASGPRDSLLRLHPRQSQQSAAATFLNPSHKQRTFDGSIVSPSPGRHGSHDNTLDSRNNAGLREKYSLSFPSIRNRIKTQPLSIKQFESGYDSVDVAMDS